MQTDLFKIPHSCLRVMGHTFDSRTPVTAAKYKIFYNCLYYGHLLLVLSAQWPLLSYVRYNIGDLELATAGVSVSVTNILSVVKIVTFLRNKSKFTTMSQRLTKLNDELQAPEAKAYLDAANNIANRLVLIYTASCASTGLYFHIAPIVKIIWHALMQQPIPMELPMPMKFVFDHEKSPWYELVFCYTAAVTVNVVTYACAVDGFFFGFAMNISGHLQALQHFIQTNLSFCVSRQKANENVSNLVQYHILILELAASVQEIFMPIVFCQFLMTSLNVCVVIYQMVSNLNSLMVMLNYAAFLMAILSQLFIYCYGGEILKEQSLMVSIAVKYSNWDELLPQQRRMILFLIKRSQREVIIKAGFYEASLANFLMIIQAAISYITIIQSIE